MDLDWSEFMVNILIIEIKTDHLFYERYTGEGNAKLVMLLGSVTWLRKKFLRPGCSKKYLGKTESTLFNRTKQHAWTQKDSAVFKHFDQCHGWGHIKGLLQCDAESVNQMLLQTNTVRDNTKIIGKADNWQVLAFKESLKIKDKRPTLNHGVKAAKDLCLF